MFLLFVCSSGVYGSISAQCLCVCSCSSFQPIWPTWSAVLPHGLLASHHNLLLHPHLTAGNTQVDRSSHTHSVHQKYPVYQQDIVLCQVLGTLLIYVLFMVEEFRKAPVENMDEVIYCVNGTYRLLEFLVRHTYTQYTVLWVITRRQHATKARALLMHYSSFQVAVCVVCYGVSETVFGEWSVMGSTIILVHSYYNVWLRAQLGWQSFLLRRDAVNKIKSLPTASHTQLEQYNDICAICYQVWAAFPCVCLKRVNDQEFTSGSEFRVGWCEFVRWKQVDMARKQLKCHHTTACACVYALISSRTWTALWSRRAVISSTLAVWRNGFMSRRHVPFVTRNSRANPQPPLPPTKTPLQPIRALQGRTTPRPVSSRKMDLLPMMGTRRKKESRRGMLDLSCQLEKPPPVFPHVPSIWRLHHHLALLPLHHLWLDLTSPPLVIPHRLPPLCLTHWTCPLPPPTFTPCPHRRQHRQRWSPLTLIPPTQLKLGFLPDSQESSSGPQKSLWAPF